MAKQLKKIPKFKDVDEEREFWATHSIVDDLDRILPLLEVPVDSFVAKHLSEHVPSLPRKWSGLKCVTNLELDRYQKAAMIVAEKKKINRVDLDVFFYREEIQK